jgi:hypothetical protein
LGQGKTRVEERKPLDASSSAAITLAIRIRETSSRNARVAALQRRRCRLRAGLDLILDQWGADMTDLPGGASGLLVRSYPTIRELKRCS